MISNEYCFHLRPTISSKYPKLENTLEKLNFEVMDIGSESKTNKLVSLILELIDNYHTACETLIADGKSPESVRTEVHAQLKKK